MNYVQQPTVKGYVLNMQSCADNLLTLGAGFGRQTPNGWLISLLFGRDQGSGNATSNSVGLRIPYEKGGASAMGMDGYSANGEMMGCQETRCRKGPPGRHIPHP